MTVCESVTAALSALCFRAGVQSGDSTPHAAQAVAACVRREVRPSTDIVHCLLNVWLGQMLPHVRTLVSTDHVVLLDVIVRVEIIRNAKVRIFELVPLPPAVRAAVARIDQLRGAA